MSRSLFKKNICNRSDSTLTRFKQGVGLDHQVQTRSTYSLFEPGGPFPPSPPPTTREGQTYNQDVFLGQEGHVQDQERIDRCVY